MSNKEAMVKLLRIGKPLLHRVLRPPPRTVRVIPPRNRLRHRLRNSYDDLLRPNEQESSAEPPPTWPLVTRHWRQQDSFHGHSWFTTRLEFHRYESSHEYEMQKSPPPHTEMQQHPQWLLLLPRQSCRHCTKPNDSRRLEMLTCRNKEYTPSRRSVYCCTCQKSQRSSYTRVLFQSRGSLVEYETL